MQKQIFAVGNAHLDPVWLWPWGEGLQAARATFRSALDRIAEHDEFVFTCAGAGIYQWIEKTDPQLFRDIQTAVAEERWYLIGGWWLQPDCNIPGGEGFVRHSLYGQRYLLEKFGRIATIGYNVDSFGHAWTLPQILVKSGMDSYVFMRPGPHENPEIPGRLFTWQGPDGSAVTAFQIPYQYNLEGEILHQRFTEIAEECTETQPMMLFYGVGNHGGGPTKASISFLDEKRGEEEPAVHFATPRQYFDAVRDMEITPSVYKNELQHHASGCYAAHSKIKRDNRKAETALESAEKWATIAAHTAGTAYPGAEIAKGWQAVLFNHFHDILAGTSIASAYAQAANLHGYALQIADEVGEFSRQAIASQVDTTGQDGVPLIVWNPTAWPRRELVHTELQWKGDAPEIIDSTGQLVLSQSMPPEAAVKPGGRVGVTFTADVPALGYRVYWAVRPKQESPAPAALPQLRVWETGMENEFLKVEFDARSGALISLFDKSSGRELLSAPAAALVIRDDSDTWSHGVFSFRDEVGSFDQAEFRIMESGPVRARLRVTTRYQQSSLRQDFILGAGQRYLDCRAVIDWHGKHQLVKLSWPVDVANPEATYEIPYGHIQRPCDGEEEPAQRWVDVTGVHPSDGQTCGLTVANDCKYSFDIKDSEIRMTVLRSPGYAHHVPRELAPDDPVEFIDQGEQEFAYRLAGHSGGWQSEEFSAPACAADLNSGLKVREDYRHSGSLPVQSSFASVSDPRIHLTVLKQAEEGRGLVVRAWETSGQDLTEPVAISAMGRKFTAKFTGHTVKTFLVTESSIAETDLLERVQD